MKRRATTIQWRDGRGKLQKRKINHVIDVRDFEGVPGYALLVAAANRDLASPDVMRYLNGEGIGRSMSWLRRRRWLFQAEGTDNGVGPKVNPDGMDERAYTIMGGTQRSQCEPL